MPKYGPETAYAASVHAEKYRNPKEGFPAAMRRIAVALSDGKAHHKALLDALLNMRFLPGGRIQAAIGSTKNVTAYNCFVSGAIADSMTGGESAIMGRATQAAQTMRLGGGIGYDFSTLRPRGARIRKLESTATGPVSFMGIYNAMGLTVSSSGHRRGAQMGVLRVDHPDIEEFISAKQNRHALSGFNISVGVTNAFMHAVERDEMFPLRFEGRTYREVGARHLWGCIMRSTWEWGEPGVLFLDTINRKNNLSYCETISATNPCGEQPLPPFGACLLGSFNLVKYLQFRGGEPVGVDGRKLYADVGVAVRALDNVIDRTTYPLPEQEHEARSKRRMGLGVTGLATALAALGQAYGSPGFLETTDALLTLIRDAAYSASVALAKEKGAFQRFDRDAYLAAPFVAGLPGNIRSGIAKHGIRNSHLLSIAPTGTISLCADNVSSGIEPVFANVVTRRAYVGGRLEEFLLQDYGYRKGWNVGPTVADVSVEDHLAVLSTAARLVDSAVSKTVNVPSDTPWHDFEGIYFRAWRAGVKGCATYTQDCKRGSVIEAATPVEEGPSSDGAACYIDNETGRRECA